MFEAAEIGRTVAKDEYDVRGLEAALGAARSAARARTHVLPAAGRVRRRRRRREERNRPPAQRVDGSTVDREPRVRRALRGRAGAAAVLAVLAGAAAARADRALPERLVFAAPARSRRPPPGRGGVRCRPRSHRSVRADTGRRRGRHPEVLDAPGPQGPEEAARGAVEGSPHALARHQDPVEALEAVPIGSPLPPNA